MANARTILIAAIFCSLYALCAYWPAHAQQTLHWGADPSGGAPYVFTDPANPDRYIGYEKEMVDALAAAMGRKAEFVPSDWETLVSALQRDSFDIIVNGLEPTGDRAQQILFSNPYYVFQLQLTVRHDDDRISSLADCKNRVVATLGNTAASRLLEQEGIPFRSYQDPVGAYRDLELKRPHLGRDADLQFPALAARLRRALCDAGALARLHARRSLRSHPRVPAPRPAIRARHRLSG